MLRSDLQCLGSLGRCRRIKSIFRLRERLLKAIDGKVDTLTIIILIDMGTVLLFLYHSPNDQLQLIKMDAEKEIVEEQFASHKTSTETFEHDASKQPPDRSLEMARSVSAPPYSIFSSRAKSFIVVAVSISSLISPFGAMTFYPALNVLADDLNVTPSLINLALTTYMVMITPR